jgi:hypothetical protein
MPRSWMAHHERGRPGPGGSAAGPCACCGQRRCNLVVAVLAVTAAGAAGVFPAEIAEAGWLARRPAAVVPSGLPAADHAGPGDAGPRTDTRAWQCPPSWPRPPPWWMGAWSGLTCMWSGLPPTSDGAFIIAVTQPAADRADCHPRHRPDLAARAARDPQAARCVPPSWDAPCKPAAWPITTFPGCVIRHGTSSGRPHRDLVRAMSAKEVSWCPEPPAEWCNPAW